METSELWRGVVHNFAGKYLGEKTIRGNSALECQRRLQDWFEMWFPWDDISLTCHRLVAVGPEVVSGKRPRPLEPEPLLQAARLWPVEAPAGAPEPRSVPVELRYI